MTLQLKFDNLMKRLFANKTGDKGSCFVGVLTYRAHCGGYYSLKFYVGRQRFRVKRFKPEMVIKCFAEVFSGG